MSLTTADLRQLRLEAHRRAGRTVAMGRPRLLELLDAAGSSTVDVPAAWLERQVARALRRRATSDPTSTLTPNGGTP